MGVNGIYGLSGSGLDIESLVKMGMLKKQSQYDKMQQTEIKNTWIKEAYTDVYSDLKKYKNITLSTYKLQSNMNAMAATSSDNSIVTATANGAAASMVHQVEVTSVATNAYLQTNNGATIKRNNTSEKATSTYLKDIMFHSVVTNGTAGNYTYTLDGGRTVNGSDVAVELVVRDSTSSTAEPHTVSYTYDDLMQGKKTLNEFASAFSKSGANIQGGYDTVNDSFSLYNKTTGSSNVIALTANNADTTTLMNNLQLAVYDGNTNTMGPTIDFQPVTVMQTTIGSKSISSENKSTSLKDVLGLSATLTDAADGKKTLTFTDAAGNKKIVTDTIESIQDTKVFAMNLSNGTNSAEISFTFGELFDLSGSGDLRAKGSLNDLANKISNAVYIDDEGNTASLGIVAAYDEASDSFSIVNPTGQANLSGKDGDVIGVSLAKTLNLVESAEGKQYAISAKAEGTTLAAMLGVDSIKIVRKATDSFELSLLDENGATLAKIRDTAAHFKDGTVAAKDAIGFSVGDGTNFADVKFDFGSLVDFSKLSQTGSHLYYNGSEVVETSKTIAANSNDAVSKLASNTKTAIENSALAGSITVLPYADNSFQLYNISGDVVFDGNASLLNNIKKESVPPTTFSKKVSSSITRAVTSSTNDSLKDAMGLSATYVKNGADDYTITLKDKAGHIKTFNGSKSALENEVAASFTVNDISKDTSVNATLAELLDLSGLQGTNGSLNAGITMSDFAAKLGSAAGADVAARYDADTKIFSLTNQKGNIGLHSTDELGSAFVDKLAMAETEASKQGKIGTQASGSNAQVKIDGKDYDLTTNKQTVAGVTYTFVGKTAGTSAKVTVTQDTDKIVDYVKQFVDTYNTLLDSLNDKLSETVYSDYKPLSTTQEAEMTETQINKWNEKAKSGLLNNSSMIRELVSSMREAIYTKVDAVDSKYNTMSAIGISSSTTKGHLTLDEDKLRKALAEDPDCVYQMFASDQDSTYIEGSTSKNKINAYQKKDDFLHTGVANRLNNVMSKYMSSISDYAGKEKGTDDQSYLGKLITNMQTKMKSFKTMMTAYESQLFKKYDAMEVALSKLGTQLSYITGGQ